MCLDTDHSAALSRDLASGPPQRVTARMYVCNPLSSTHAPPAAAPTGTHRCRTLTACTAAPRPADSQPGPTLRHPKERAPRKARRRSGGGGPRGPIGCIQRASRLPTPETTPSGFGAGRRGRRKRATRRESTEGSLARRRGAPIDFGSWPLAGQATAPEGGAT